MIFQPCVLQHSNPVHQLKKLKFSQIDLTKSWLRQYYYYYYFIIAWPLSQFRSNILPLSSLCIHRGKSVWVLYVDATCINYDGNAFDATLLAMVAALKNSTYIIISFWSVLLLLLTLCFTLPSSWVYVLLATLPQATFDPEKNVTICSRRAPKLPLQLNPNTPISVSFGIFDSCVIRFFLSYNLNLTSYYYYYYLQKTRSSRPNVIRRTITRYIHIRSRRRTRKPHLGISVRLNSRFSIRRWSQSRYAPRMYHKCEA